MIEHWAFIALARGLCPAFVRHMCKGVPLGSAWLGTLYADTEKKTEYSSVAGIGIDISRREVCHVHPSAHLFNSSVISMVVFQKLPVITEPFFLHHFFFPGNLASIDLGAQWGDFTGKY